jgi:hypothetical protein
MKKIVRVLLSMAVVAVTIMLAAQTIWAQEDATNIFLAKNYGWHFSIKQERRFLKWSWNLVCEPGRAALPEKGKNIFYSWVCRQRDDSQTTVVIWRLPSVKSEAIEKQIFNGMSAGLGYGKVECTEEVGINRGTIKSCSVPLQSGTYYVSFFHFEAKTPTPYVAETNDVVKESSMLGFTIYAQNNKRPNPEVKEKLKELVNSIQFTD